MSMMTHGDYKMLCLSYTAQSVTRCSTGARTERESTLQAEGLVHKTARLRVHVKFTECHMTQHMGDRASGSKGIIRS